MIEPAAIVPIENPREITPEWLTGVLATGGVNARIDAIRHEEVGRGQTGACYRLHIQADRPAPQTLILKTAAGSAEQRARVSRAYQTEMLFYSRLASSARIRSPRCWHAALSNDGLSFALLLEDASPAVPGVQEQGCGEQTARAALVELARLHGAFWKSPLLVEEAGALALSDAGAEGMGQIHAHATEVFLNRYADALDAHQAEVLRGAARLSPAWLKDRSRPSTLLHGDFRLDNLMISPAGDVVTAIDWQTIAIGFALRDVAYFLSTSLSSAQRRGSEERLLRAYHEHLIAQCGADYGLDACFDDYRFGMLQAPVIMTIGCALSPYEQTPRADSMFLSMAERVVTAFDDHDVLNRVAAQLQPSGTTSSAAGVR